MESRNIHYWPKGKLNEEHLEYNDVSLATCLDLFAELPWNSDLQKSSDAVFQDLPTLEILHPNGEYLSLIKTSDGFVVNYNKDDRHSHIKLSDEFPKATSLPSPEEVIVLFYGGKIEDVFSSRQFDEEEDTDEEPAGEKLTANWANLPYFMLLFFALFSAMFFGATRVAYSENYDVAWIALAITLAAFLYFFLTAVFVVQAILEDRNKTIFLNPSKKTISVIKGEETIAYDLRKLKKASMVNSKKWNYGYLRLKFGDQESLIITTLIIYPEYITSSFQLKCEKSEVNFPLISKGILSNKQVANRKKESEDKKLELRPIFETKTEAELRIVLNNPEDYDPGVVELAKEILDRRSRAIS